LIAIGHDDLNTPVQLSPSAVVIARDWIRLAKAVYRYA
jgi:hypothetical protein